MAPAFYQKACFIDAGAQLVDRAPQLNYTKIVVRNEFRPDQTSLTFNSSLVKEVLSHPEVAAPGSVTYVAPTVPNTIDATDKFLFAEWPARAGTKDLDANTAGSFGNQVCGTPLRRVRAYCAAQVNSVCYAFLAHLTMCGCVCCSHACKPCNSMPSCTLPDAAMPCHAACCSWT